MRFRTSWVVCVGAMGIAAVAWQSTSTPAEPVPKRALAPSDKLTTTADRSSSTAVVTNDERNGLRRRLAGDEPDRWLSAWNDGLSRMNAAELWALSVDPALAQQVETKVLRNSLTRGCVVSSSEREFALAKPGLVDDWCRDFVPLGGTQFLRAQAAALSWDPELLSSTSHVLGTRVLRGTPEQRDGERRMLEHAFQTASDPWTLRESIRNLWRYRSSLLLADWSGVDALARFQQQRLGELVAVTVTCRVVDDCDAASPWIVELCAFFPGLACTSGSNIDALAATNLSPVERTILLSAVDHTLRTHTAARPRN